MKKLWICILLFALVGCTTTANKEEEKDSGPSYCDEDVSSTCSLGKSADMSGYEGFDVTNSKFEESDMDTVLRTFEEQKDGIFFFSFPACPWCVEALPILNEIAVEQKVKIQYVQTRDADKNLLYTEEQKQTLIPLVSEFLNKDKDGAYQLYVPFVLVVKDGKAISGHVGTVDGHDAHERKMTEDEIKQLTAVYEEMLK